MPQGRWRRGRGVGAIQERRWQIVVAPISMGGGYTDSAQRQHRQLALVGTAAADALFQEALALVGQAEYAETSLDLIITYADLLSQRGDHQQAAHYYRKAAQWRGPHFAC